MSAAARKSSQNRRIITSSLRPSVSDSGHDYNSKLRGPACTADYADDTDVGSKLKPQTSTEPVLGPGVGAVTVAAGFPETGLIFGNEFNRANKLGPFPCIKFRHNHARRATVIARDRFAIELRSYERIVIECIFD